eukprot:CAMPEP_0173063948 /NCGR_PEP_ID=MMETSP1102-20130122/4710_1 /TAXON_ID=49646 /ORGANISM="Geminigera sp., Strain Caron Lab Isolate" /LENGTH=239 /DNA_ID=CAMNT_0013930893 /DNA_START=217 /DNA_END=936 /DNA_ORIENTATION=+
MSGGAPKGPRMATPERLNKQREHNDPEYKQQRHNSFHSFFARTLRTSENSLTHPGTPACSTQTVSAEPTATTLSTPLTPSFRTASLLASPAATTLPKSLAPSLGPASLAAAVDEIMADAPAVIPPISAHSGGFSRLRQHNPAARPFLHEDGYPPVPKTLTGRIDNKIYLHHATQQPVRWKARAKDFFCVCDLNLGVPFNGMQIKRCPNLKALYRSCASTLPQLTQCVYSVALERVFHSV